ncbi:MAG: TolB family protein [Bryobacteraceae bacterium]
MAEPTVPGHGPAVVLISSATGERRAITTPPAGWRGDSIPMFSPDSTHVVFRRTMPQSGIEDLYEVPVSDGQPQRLTFNNRMIGSFSFAPDGSLLFSSKRDSSISPLWWMAPYGSRISRLTSPIIDASWVTVSRNAKHFAFSRRLYDVNIWRVNADGSGPATPLIDSKLPDTGAQFSPDGRKIAFRSVRSGTDGIWVCDADGANAVRLTDGGAADSIGNRKWSPDGRQIAFEWQRSGRSEVYTVASEGGTPRKLVADNSQNSVPAWSHDGRFLYFASNRDGGQKTIWKVSTEGGTAIPITKRRALLRWSRRMAGIFTTSGTKGRSGVSLFAAAFPTAPKARLKRGCLQVTGAIGRRRTTRFFTSRSRQPAKQKSNI